MNSCIDATSSSSHKQGGPRLVVVCPATYRHLGEDNNRCGSWLKEGGSNQPHTKADSACQENLESQKLKVWAWNAPLNFYVIIFLFSTFEYSPISLTASKGCSSSTQAPFTPISLHSIPPVAILIRFIGMEPTKGRLQ